MRKLVHSEEYRGITLSIFENPVYKLLPFEHQFEFDGARWVGYACQNTMQKSIDEGKRHIDEKLEE